VRRRRHACDLTRQERRWLVLGQRVERWREVLVDGMFDPLQVQPGLGALSRELEDAARGRGLDEDAARRATLALLDAVAVLEVAL
jgi:hypothetical protein